MGVSMNRDLLRQMVIEEIKRLGQRFDFDAQPPSNARFREDLEFDSYDFANLIAALDERLGVKVPRADYSKIQTLDACADYFAARVAPTPG